MKQDPHFLQKRTQPKTPSAVAGSRIFKTAEQLDQCGRSTWITGHSHRPARSRRTCSDAAWMRALAEPFSI
jgi:hypothetical protein